MGSTLELTGEGDIYYTVNGLKGNIVTKEYTKGISMLQDLTVNVDVQKYYYNLNDTETSFNIVAKKCDSLTFKAVGADDITFNGDTISSNCWTESVSVSGLDGAYQATFTSSADGKDKEYYHYIDTDKR